MLFANNSKAGAELYTFIILLSTAAVVIVYLASSLAAWNNSPAPKQRLVIALALLFIAFATYGLGLEASLWSLVLLAVGLAIRALMHRINSGGATPVAATGPAAPRE